MIDHFGNGRIIGYHKAFEAPLIAQQVGHQPFVGRGRNAIYFVERRHHTSGSRINSGFVWRQVFVVHADAAHVGGVVIASGLGSAIQREMLDAGHNGVVL